MAQKIFSKTDWKSDVKNLTVHELEKKYGVALSTAYRWKQQKNENRECYLKFNNAFKDKVMCHATRFSVAEASKLFEVSENAIYVWMRSRDVSKFQHMKTPYKGLKQRSAGKK